MRELFGMFLLRKDLPLTNRHKFNRFINIFQDVWLHVSCIKSVATVCIISHGIRFISKSSASCLSLLYDSFRWITTILHDRVLWWQEVDSGCNCLIQWSVSLHSLWVLITCYSQELHNVQVICLYQPLPVIVMLAMQYHHKPGLINC